MLNHLCFRLLTAQRKKLSLTNQTKARKDLKVRSSHLSLASSLMVIACICVYLLSNNPFTGVDEASGNEEDETSEEEEGEPSEEEEEKPIEEEKDGERTHPKPAKRKREMGKSSHDYKSNVRGVNLQVNFVQC